LEISNREHAIRVYATSRVSAAGINPLLFLPPGPPTEPLPRVQEGNREKCRDHDHVRGLGDAVR
jgi:hypothetical protein